MSIDDTTEYESQDNGLVEDTVREVKDMTRSIKITLSELYKKDISSKHPMLSWIVSYAADQITGGHIEVEWVDVTSKTEMEVHFESYYPVFDGSVVYHPLRQESKSTVDSWNVGAMDCFSGSLTRSSEFFVDTAFDVVRVRSL